jgi:hypothetical protein
MCKFASVFYFVLYVFSATFLISNAELCPFSTVFSSKHLDGFEHQHFSIVPPQTTQLFFMSLASIRTVSYRDHHFVLFTIQYS